MKYEVCTHRGAG